MAKNDAWTRDQLIMALNDYCKIPFKDVKEWHPIIQKYAPLIGRTPVALKMKVGNFGRFDLNLRAKGITGFTTTSFLEACHISGWADDINNRTNPQNGLCMNPLFHRSYYKMYIAVTPNYQIVISEQMIDETKNMLFRDYLLEIQGQSIMLPEKFTPDKDLLAQHYDQYRANQ